MSRIYDALKRAAEQSKDRPVSEPPPTETGKTILTLDAPHPSGAGVAAPAPGPSPAALRPAADPLRKTLKAVIADRVSVEAWERLEVATLRELDIGRLPRTGGGSAWMLEAMGGVALGGLVAAVSVFMNFFVGVWLLHIRVPRLPW